MSELKTQKIKQVILKPQPWGAQGYYGHRVVFEDGSKGEIYHCKEANPSWLKEGQSLTYTLQRSNFPDTPFVLTMDVIEQENEQGRSERSESSTAPYNSNNRFKGKGNGGWKPYERFEDKPDIWMMKQKFISVLKFYEVLMPLVVKGDIKYEDIQKEVIKHLDFTISSSGMNVLPQPSTGAPVRSAEKKTPTAPAPALKTAVRQVSPAKPESKTQSRELDIHPSEYTDTLFEEDPELKSEPIPADILKKIQECKKYASLKKIQQGLSPDQMKNKNIMDAFFKKKGEFTKKK